MTNTNRVRTALKFQVSCNSAIPHPTTRPVPSSTSPTTSYTLTQTMQAAVHQMPQMLPQYPRQSLNGVINGAHVIPPTPPVATRKRKRPHQYTVSYSEVQEVDSEGKLREVIVIDDTPPPPTISPATTYTNGFSASYQPPQYSAPIRTRARAAAEAQALSASTSSVAIIAPAPKKRKRDPMDDARATITKKPPTAIQQQQPVATTKSWASGSGAATDEVSIYMCISHRYLMLTWQFSGVKGSCAL